MSIKRNVSPTSDLKLKPQRRGDKKKGGKCVTSDIIILQAQEKYISKEEKEKEGCL